MVWVTVAAYEILLLFCENFDTLPEEFLGQVEGWFVMTLWQGCSNMPLSIRY